METKGGGAGRGAKTQKRETSINVYIYIKLRPNLPPRRQSVYALFERIGPKAKNCYGGFEELA